LSHDTIYIPDCPLVTVDVSVEDWIFHGREVARTIAEGPLRPRIIQLFRRDWLMEEMEDPLYVRIQETVSNSMTAEHA
jgi:hypothetical protein